MSRLHFVPELKSAQVDAQLRYLRTTGPVVPSVDAGSSTAPFTRANPWGALESDGYVYSTRHGQGQSLQALHVQEVGIANQLWGPPHVCNDSGKCGTFNQETPSYLRGHAGAQYPRYGW